MHIVYDMSAKGKFEESSLNERLYRGSVILCRILLRFFDFILLFYRQTLKRSWKYRVLIEMLLDFWLKGIVTLAVDDSNVMVYQFCQVLICSPFLPATTIKYHLHKEDLPLATHTGIQDNIYVDNVLIGVKSANKAFKVYEEAKIMFEKASMNLREWNSNSTDFLNFIQLLNVLMEIYQRCLGYCGIVLII